MYIMFVCNYFVYSMTSYSLPYGEREQKRKGNTKCIHRGINLEGLAFALVQTVHSWQFQRCIPLLGIVLFTHMLRAFRTVSLITFVLSSHLQFSRNISILSCSMTDCFDCFPIISAIIYLLVV